VSFASAHLHTFRKNFLGNGEQRKNGAVDFALVF
jgi:hypothetical protein